VESFRDHVIETLRAELFGPAEGPEESVLGRPAWRYLCGMLFPSNLDAQALAGEDESDEAAVDENVDASVALAYESLPSSMGVSFYIRIATSLNVSVEAAHYEPTKQAGDEEGKEFAGQRGRVTWRRRPIAEPSNP
jgi:hypothetical protein